MKLFHTSPKKIEKFSKFGNFDEYVLLSSNVYEMSAGKTITYAVNADDMRFVEACDLHNDEVISEIAERFDIDLDEAESLLDGSDSVWNHGFGDADADWFIQARRGECAKKMGFDGCKDHDEQGTVYIIPMFGRESILVEE